MELTQNQELYISQYIDKIEEKIGDQLSPKQRERALSRLRARIDDKISAEPSSSIEDAELLNLLHKMGQPETQAAILVRVWGDIPGSFTASTVLPATSASETSDGQGGVVPQAVTSEASSTGEGKTPTTETRGPVWLGVALYISSWSGLPVWLVRFLIFLLGVFTGPVALLLYVILFLALRICGCVQSPAPFHPFRIILHPALTGGILTLFHFGGIYGIRGIYMAHQKYLGRPVPELNEWAWLESEALYLYIGALVLLLPLSLLSAMPMANAWDYSLKRLTQAGVVLYAITLSFGLGFFITGIILNFVHEFT